MTGAVGQSAERTAFYGKIGECNMTALWNVLGDLVTPEPRSGCRAAAWKFDEVRAYMMEAGRLITAKEAERRVLVLENPGLRGGSRITTSLYAGVQLVMPGEVAPAHRHTQSALRFILEGDGAYTAVDGERAIMKPGDFIITPSMTWHDHGNDTDQPMFWLDGLDIPLVQFLSASFAETLGQDSQPVSRPPGASFARFGNNLLPIDHHSRSQTSPIFAYPYAYVRDTLDTMMRSSDPDPCHGIKMRYVNPATGSWAMPTIGAFIQVLPASFRTARYRSTDATVFVPIEGRGRTWIGHEVFEWKLRDIIVAPSWQWVSHEADEEAVLFGYSDRPVQEKLDLFREDRGNA